MAEATRDALISAAASLLDRGGPAAVTLRAVGEAAGVSHNAPYKHFADKDALLAAVAGRELSRLPRRQADAGDAAAPAPTAKALMTGYVRWAHRRPERFRLAFGRWTRQNPELAEAATQSRANLVAAVERGQAADELPQGDPERLAALLLALAHGAADLALAGHLAADGKGRADPEDLVEDLFRHLMAGARK